MKVKLIGVRSINFEDKKTGNEISGIKLFIAYPETDVYGLMTDDRFISDNVFVSFGVPVKDLIESIDSDINLEINPKGKVVGISLCQTNLKQ